MYRIGVIGGGAAGMMAAAAAAQTNPDVQVVLFEKNEKLGKKLYITGKGRCNLTNTARTADSFSQIPRNPKFLYSAFYSFDHDAVMSFFEESGVRLKTERGGRVFPSSDHASDITRALEKRMRAAGVQIRLNTRIMEIRTQEKKDAEGGETERRVTSVLTADGKEEPFDALIIAAGGISYPQTGSTGDGYRFARESGHRVEPCRPSLVPMETEEAWCSDLMGLSLRNVNVKLFAGGMKRCIAEAFGEMLFTHFGVSGPVILTLSAFPQQQQIDAGLMLSIDLKPALDEVQLDRRLLRDFEKYGSRDMANAMKDLLPQRLIAPVLMCSGVPADLKARDLTRMQRMALRQTLKDLRLHVKGLRGYNEAIITRGGVSVREIDPSAMASKRVSGLYFAGEVIDTDALTGGYNLQIAWSTGHLAGVSAARQAAGAAESG